jgi:cobalt-zinc-cadmium efflux system membrane fusion protein
MTTRMILTVLALAACRAAPQEEHEGGEHHEEGGHGEDEHVDEPEHGELPTRVHLAPELAAAAGVVATPVRREVLVGTFEVVGQIEADPDRESRISSRVAGTLSSIEFREGDTVAAGQRLASIRAPDLGELRAHKTSLVARLAAAKAQVDRLVSLEAKRLAATQDVVAAKAEVAALQADLAGATHQLRALGDGKRAGGAGELAVLAPRRGVVIARQAIVGDPVTADTVLGTVADLDEVFFAARVFERDLAKMHVGASAEVTLGAYPGDPFVGTVERVGHTVDPTTRTIVARIRLHNRQERLRAGLFGTADVALDQVAGPEPVLVIARAALTQIAGNSVVFVQEADGHYEVHPVVLGASSPGKLEVVHGLREGELVVTEGVFTLKSTLLRSTFAEDHH